MELKYVCTFIIVKIDTIYSELIKINNEILLNHIISFVLKMEKAEKSNQQNEESYSDEEYDIDLIEDDPFDQPVYSMKPCTATKKGKNKNYSKYKPTLKDMENGVKSMHNLVEEKKVENKCENGKEINYKNYFNITISETQLDQSLIDQMIDYTTIGKKLELLEPSNPEYQLSDIELPQENSILENIENLRANDFYLDNHKAHPLAKYLKIFKAYDLHGYGYGTCYGHDGIYVNIKEILNNKNISLKGKLKKVEGLINEKKNIIKHGVNYYYNSIRNRLDNIEAQFKKTCKKDENIGTFNEKVVESILSKAYAFMEELER